MFPGLSAEEIAAGLDAVAGEILEVARLPGPPVDAWQLARALRLTVSFDDGQSGRGRYVRLRGVRGRPPRPTILLRRDPRPERQQWALAHEIGEHVAHWVFARLGADPREVAPYGRERVAAQLAGRLLVPTPWLAADASACAWDLLALKARYRTASHELIARRMLELPQPAIITIFDQGKLGFRRANVPGRVPALSRAEMDCWRAVHRRNQPRELRQGMTIIRGWPVHEDSWKREILRTQLDLELMG
ncbi:MAG: ImmA/IrrE family metallo-endopeptidase [Thermoguttaceae bacterium]